MSVVISKNDQLISQSKSLHEEGVEFMGVISKNGRLIESSGNYSIGMPKDKKEMFFMKIALRNSMQKDFDEYLGEVNYCLTQRGNDKFISMPISEDKTIFVVTKKSIDTEKIVSRIKILLDWSKKIIKEKNSRGGGIE